jgi:hypothetical protein
MYSINVVLQRLLLPLHPTHEAHLSPLHILAKETLLSGGSAQYCRHAFVLLSILADPWVVPIGPEVLDAFNVTDSLDPTQASLI